MSEWTAAETNTHQDHVIAHVLGATVEGYFVWDETAYLLLDIGFIWNIYLDGEMGLVPHPVSITELSVTESAKDELRQDIDALLRRTAEVKLKQMTISPVTTPIQGVEFFELEQSRRMLITCEQETLEIETSLDTREVEVRSGFGSVL